MPPAFSAAQLSPPPAGSIGRLHNMGATDCALPASGSRSSFYTNVRKASGKAANCSG